MSAETWPTTVSGWMWTVFAGLNAFIAVATAMSFGLNADVKPLDQTLVDFWGAAVTALVCSLLGSSLRKRPTRLSAGVAAGITAWSLWVWLFGSNAEFRSSPVAMVFIALIGVAGGLPLSRWSDLPWRPPRASSSG